MNFKSQIKPYQYLVEKSQTQICFNESTDQGKFNYFSPLRLKKLPLNCFLTTLNLIWLGVNAAH